MCVNVSLPQPFLFIPVLFICVLLSLFELPQYKKLDILFLEVRPLIFHELSNQDKAVFWQESQCVGQEKLAAAQLLCSIAHQ